GRKRSGRFLLRLPALGAAQLFTRQFLVEGLATVDTDLAAFIFSAHALDCGEPSLCLAKVPPAPASIGPCDAQSTPNFRIPRRVTRFRPHVTLRVTPGVTCPTLG